jgi:hypothetical protein
VAPGEALHALRQVAGAFRDHLRRGHAFAPVEQRHREVGRVRDEHVGFRHALERLAALAHLALQCADPLADFRIAFPALVLFAHLAPAHHHPAHELPAHVAGVQQRDDQHDQRELEQHRGDGIQADARIGRRMGLRQAEQQRHQALEDGVQGIAEQRELDQVLHRFEQQAPGEDALQPRGRVDAVEIRLERVERQHRPGLHQHGEDARDRQHQEDGRQQAEGFHQRGGQPGRGGCFGEIQPMRLRQQRGVEAQLPSPEVGAVHVDEPDEGEQHEHRAELGALGDRAALARLLQLEGRGLLGAVLLLLALGHG